MSQKTAYIDSIQLVLKGVMRMCGPKLFSKRRKEISSFKKTWLHVYLYLLREIFFFFCQTLGFLFLNVMAAGKISGKISLFSTWSDPLSGRLKKISIKQ